MHKRPFFRRKRIVLPIVALTFAAAVLSVSLLMLERHAASPKTSSATTTHGADRSVPTTTETQQQPAAFDKSRYSTSDAASLWVVVNKTHPLSPVDYAPSDIVTAYGKLVSSRMTGDLDALIAASKEGGVGLTLASGYRSYDYQKNLYASYVAKDGVDKADRYSARAGYSEHQTGLAVDFGDTAGTCIVEDCYADTAEAKWLAANAYKYGFLLRYTADDQNATGYQAEAWHYRYIGRDLAAAMHDQNIPTLEQFFGISGGASYGDR